MKCVIWLSIIVLLKNASTQFIPRNPCPDIFQYQSEGSEIVGVIRLTSNLQSSFIRVFLRLFLTQTLPSNYYGSLELLEGRERSLQNMMDRLPILYRVKFPLRNPLPSVVEITVNGRTICSGPDMVESEIRGAYTNIQMEHTFETTISNRQFLSFNELSPNNLNSFSNFNNFNNDNNNNLDNFNNDRDINIESPLLSNFSSSWETNRERPFRNNFNNNREINRNPSFQNNFNNNREINRNPPFRNNFNNNREINRNPPFQNNFNNNREINRDPPFQNNFNNNREINRDLPFQNNFIPQSQITTSTIAPPVSSDSIEIVTRPTRTATRQSCGQSGVGLIPLIIGGEPIEPGSWPWLVAIYLKQRTGLSYKCGGNLISQNIVISAAHCFMAQGARYSASNVLITLGRHNLLNWNEPNSKTMEPSEIILHPEYKTATSSDADIALLYLNQLLEFTQHIQPICLWSGSTNVDDIQNREGTVVGWGVDETGFLSSEPKRVKTRIVSDSVCLRSNSNFVPITSNRTFCAGLRNGLGPCSGDSGSGLMLHQNNRWTLRGLVSVALPDDKNNCNLKEYVIYVDVAKYIDWIRSYM